MYDEYHNVVGDNCINCYYSDGKYCSIKNRKINQHSPICWSFKDCFTMRSSVDFQDIEDTYDDI